MSIEDFINQELIKSIREQTAKSIAEEIVNVQPMDPDLINRFSEAAKSKEWLVKNGYKPVSSLGLLYTKDDNKE